MKPLIEEYGWLAIQDASPDIQENVEMALLSLQRDDKSNICNSNTLFR